MIIDIILDAKDGDYNPREFYNYVSESEAFFDSDWSISRALDSGTNQDVQNALCKYIDVNQYNSEIKTFINLFTWIK